MFYIAKLARRLARLRLSLTTLPMLSLLCLVVACAAGEPTGISTDSPSLPDAPVVLSPQVMTLEGTQQVLFRAFESDLTTQVTSIEWTASGGSIAGDGTYSSSTTGNFRVVGKRVGNPHNLPDTSTVIVVPVQTTLASVVVSPSGASVIGGQRQQYTAAGLMSDGSTVAIGVTWSATGGTIDAGGLFMAGNTGGTFQVIATHVTTGIADTVPVTVRAVQSIALSPTSASLSTAGTQQFAVTGTLSDGSTASLTTVGYSASGGTISTNGLYTAPLAAGSYTVKAQLAPGTGTGPSATALVAVTATTSLTFSGPWHEPNGFTPVFNSPFTALITSTSVPNSEGWRGSPATGLGNYSQANDATAPASPSQIVRITYPAGMPGGNDNSRIVYAGPFATNTGYLYQRITVKVDPNWSDNGNAGTKFSFFKNTSLSINHFINLTGYGTPQFNVARQDPNDVGNDHYWYGPTYSKGAWHTLEVLVTPNTPGIANGTLMGWLDGQLVTWKQSNTGQLSTNPNNIMWFAAGETPGYNQIYFAGTYGGGYNPVPSTQYVWFDHWYASTK